MQSPGGGTHSRLRFHYCRLDCRGHQHINLDGLFFRFSIALNPIDAAVK
ncbi:unnamed protein product, partial [Vitis vinifera]|uniref:Uncharacterized protein n=1 Tax=Vitis vinifera TaxID=29760 RepID=D7U9V0_VITVI